jgi:hypothetical protein
VRVQTLFPAITACEGGGGLDGDGFGWRQLRDSASAAGGGSGCELAGDAELGDDGGDLAPDRDDADVGAPGDRCVLHSATSNYPILGSRAGGRVL